MTAPFQLGVPVSGIIWNTLETALETSMRLLIKDIAKTLGQPEAPLLQAIRSEKVRPYIFEESDDTRDVEMRCPILCIKPDAHKFCQPCNQPVLWSLNAPRCAEHAYVEINATYSNLPALVPLEKGVHDELLYVSEDDTVYNTEYVAVGSYQRESKKLFLFEVVS